MTTPLRMGEDWSHMAERILDLTLEIIYVLTGEDYEVVKKTSGQLSKPTSCHHEPIRVAPTYSLTTMKNNDILKVISKMIELLTGKEWQYIEGHKNLYKDATLVNHPPLTSTGGSSNSNPPERCTGPLCGQEDHNYACHHQDKRLTDTVAEVKKEDENLRGDQPSVEGGDMMKTIKVEEEETCVRSDQQCLEGGDIMRTNTVEQEEMYVRNDQQSMEEGDMMRTIKVEEETHVRSDKQSVEEGDLMRKIKEEEEEETDVSDGEQSMKEGYMMRTIKEEEDTYVRSDQQTMEEGDAMRTINKAETYVRDGHVSTEEGELIRTIKEEEEEIYVMSDQQTAEAGEVTRTIIEEGETCERSDQQTMEEGDMMRAYNEEEEMRVRSDQLFTEEHEMMETLTREGYFVDNSTSDSKVITPGKAGNRRKRGKTSVGGKRRRMSYDAGFKLKVVSRAEETNNCTASREFNICEKQVRDWRKHKDELQRMPKSKKALRGIRTVYGALETDLNSWVLECRQNGYSVTRMGIRLRALQMAKDDKYKTQGIEKFAASGGWCTRFMNRYSLCLRQKTQNWQKLPPDLKEKAILFHKFIRKQRKLYNYDLGDIGNMDETAMTFDLPSKRIVASLRDKSGFLRATGNEKNHFTVVLSCLANGIKLRPVIIFKRENLPKKAKFPPRITVRAHLKGWMDEQGTKKWLEEIWNERPGAALEKRSSLLVWDMFKAHTSDSIKKMAKSCKTTLAVIPGGLSSVLQPLDVPLNKLFKDRVRSMWLEWVSSDEVRFAKGRSFMKPGIEMIAKWVRDAWEAIPEDTIRSAFQKCGISNPMDGIEDHALHEHGGNDSDNDYFHDDNVYADDVTPAEFEALFGLTDDDDSDFEG
ncbi:uncharacterized protein [Hyperolius riggenbachi]|uniref:uncharacterized protein n=1 Tax=Hyperolius riggenbachi TaxID=752182 RepID=UPI0035A28BE6